MKINKKEFLISLLAGIGSTITIGFLGFLSYQTKIGFFLTFSFGSTVVLLFGYPENNFSQPKNIFFGHIVCALIGVLFINLFEVNFISIAFAVGLSVMIMILFKITHPPAGGNPIIVMLGGVSYEFLLFPIITGSILIIFVGIIYNRLILKKQYPIKWHL